jgi:multimeric flavodoxin WrbA
MKVIGIQSSPNTDGLTSMLATAVLDGAESKGVETELVHLNQLDIKSCKAHNLDGRGWGTCRTKGTCMIKDDFRKLRSMINEADALVFSTPVYFGDISESAKRFLDRLCRCERSSPDSPLTGKPVIGIAAAGGSGGGAVNALHNLETYLRRLKFTIFDLVPVTQKSKTHKLDMLRVAGQRLASEEP